MEQEDDIVEIQLDEFDDVSAQIVLLDTYKIPKLGKWVCLHCTIAVFYDHRTIGHE